MPGEPTTSGATFDRNTVRLELWGPGDLPLLTQLLGDPAMTTYLGGPESEAQLAARQARYERLSETGNNRMFKIIYQPAGEAVGSVGFWESAHHDKAIYEAGWSVLPAYQGRGIAVAGMRQVIEMAKAAGRHRSMHAFPAVANLPSNAVCRKLGFTLVEEFDGEYPKGHFMQCNDWRLDLTEIQ